jgi:hypothetical protein
MLSKKDIIAANDTQVETVNVPEWGGSVRVQGLNGEQWDEFEQSLVIGKGRGARVNIKTAMARLCAMCMVDDKGGRLFSDADVDALNTKSAAALNRIYKVASRLCGHTEEDIEDIVKNSEVTSDGDSGTV